MNKQEKQELLLGFSSYQKIVTFLDGLEEEYDSWDVLTSLCEAFVAGLEALPVGVRAKLEPEAVSTIKALIEECGMVQIDVKNAWLLPDKLLPWAAQFADCAYELDFRFDDQHKPEGFIDDASELEYLRPDPERSIHSYHPDTFSDDLFREFCLRSSSYTELETIEIMPPFHVTDENLVLFREAFSKRSHLKFLVIDLMRDHQWDVLSVASWPHLEAMALRIFSSEKGLQINHAAAFPELKILEVELTDLPETGIFELQDFLSVDQFPKLEKLLIEKKDESGVITKSLVDTFRLFPNLNSITIKGCTFEDGALELLARDFPEGQLTELSLESEVQETSLDGFFEEASTRGVLSELTTLNIVGFSLSNQSLGVYLDRQTFPLLSCSLGFDGLNDEHIHQLVDSGSLSKVEEINLDEERAYGAKSKSELTSDGATYLINKLQDKALESLTVYIKNVGLLDFDDCMSNYFQQSDNARFAELQESLLDSDRFYWYSLVKQMDGFEKDAFFEDAVLPYVLEQVQNWEQERELLLDQGSLFLEERTRVFPDAWRNKLQEDGPFPELVLVDSIKVHSPQELELFIQTKAFLNVKAMHIQFDTYEHPYEDLNGLLEKLPSATFWKGLKHLTFVPHDDMPERDLVHFCNILSSTSLESLKLDSFGEGHVPKALEALAASGVFDTLVRLEFYSVVFREEDISMFAQTPNWNRLKALILVHGSELSPKALGDISRYSEHLHYFRVNSCDLIPGSLSSFVDGGSLAYLQKLELEDASIEPVALSSLLRANWPALTELSLLGNMLGDHGVEELEYAIPQLLDAPFIDQLEKLNLIGTYLGDEDAKSLADCERIKNIENLWLGVNPIDEAGCQLLAQSPYIKEQKSLKEWREDVYMSEYH